MPFTKPELVITDKKMNEFVSEQPLTIPSVIIRMLMHKPTQQTNSSNDKKPHYQTKQTKN